MLRKVYVGSIAVTGLVAVLAGCGSGQQTSLARGQELFKTCVPCHGADGGGNLALRTPDIAGLPDWYLRAELHKFAKDVRGAHPDDMEGHRMRPMARTLYHPGDVEDVADYVSRLKPVHGPRMITGNVAAGQTQFSTVCVACHNADARGNIAVGAPPIADQSDWYLLAQLRKFKSGMRGVNADDTTGMQMRAMSMTLQDSTAMRDVVAYIKTLSH